MILDGTRADVQDVTYLDIGLPASDEVYDRGFALSQKAGSQAFPAGSKTVQSREPARTLCDPCGAEGFELINEPKEESAVAGSYGNV